MIFNTLFTFIAECPLPLHRFIAWRGLTRSADQSSSIAICVTPSKSNVPKTSRTFKRFESDLYFFEVLFGEKIHR